MPTMLIQVLAHTPRWVFALFFALLALGVQQLFSRQASLRRVALLPAAMSVLALYGVLAAFPTHLMAAVAWAGCGALAAAIVLRRPVPAGIRFDGAANRFHLPGSAVPLALMMGVFFTKYAVGVALSQVPQLALEPAFAFGCSALYGMFSGLFVGRAARLYTLVARNPVTLHTATA